MSSKAPLISIILPTFNRREFLRRAIGSVLNQTYQDWELIVWDDGSIDSSKDVILAFDDPRVQYYNAENRGVAAARNQAISKANGDYLAFLDSDDEWGEDKLSIQIAALQDHPDIDMVLSDFENVNIVRNTRGENFTNYKKAFQLMTTSKLDPGFFEIKHGFIESIASGNFIATDTVIIKKSIILRIGGFNETLRNSEDFELWWRLGLNTVRVAFHDQVLLTRYKPQGSLTSLTPESAINTLHALDICAKEANSVNQAELVDYLRPAYRNAWQNMITAYAMENDKKRMIKAFKQSLKYGFRPGSVRLLLEGLLKTRVTR